jgi:demethylmenaquinone methyltransferase / 2-methoxy-6-polyprenyl-1,4-benzoquinol methylase
MPFFGLVPAAAGLAKPATDCRRGRLGYAPRRGRMATNPAPRPGRIAPHPDLREYYPEAAARRRFVDDLFDRTARHYDWLDGVLSLGSGRRYRRAALQRAGIGAGMTVLDVAVGTGPVARAARALTGDQGRVVGLDASFGMLRQARANVAAPLVRALAEELPLADRTVDALTMGYALRHVRDLATAFREYRRVLKPGGRVLLLELTRPAAGTLSYAALRLYMRRVIPAVARLRGGRDAGLLMSYFWDTIERCVPPETILEALAASGFEQVRRQVQCGIFSEYTARRPG